MVFFDNLSYQLNLDLEIDQSLQNLLRDRFQVSIDGQDDFGLGKTEVEIEAGLDTEVGLEIELNIEAGFETQVELLLGAGVESAFENEAKTRTIEVRFLDGNYFSFEYEVFELQSYFVEEDLQLIQDYHHNNYPNFPQPQPPYTFLANFSQLVPK